MKHSMHLPVVHLDTWDQRLLYLYLKGIDFNYLIIQILCSFFKSAIKTIWDNSVGDGEKSTHDQHVNPSK